MIYTCDSCHAIFEAKAPPKACPACSDRYVIRHWKVWEEDGTIQIASQLPAVREAGILEQNAFLRRGFSTLQEIRELDAPSSPVSSLSPASGKGRTPRMPVITRMSASNE